MKKDKCMEDMIREFDYVSKKHRILLQLYCISSFICIFWAYFQVGAFLTVLYIILLVAVGGVMVGIFNWIENNIDKKIAQMAEKK